jgi:DtxR family Mn-dependent transcriptional regulator
MVKYTTSEENYIKAIFHLQKQATQVSTKELAGALQTKPASVTDMMKKLKTKKLLNYKPYYGFRLSAEGNRVALGIIRWDEVHEVAEQLEHVSSMKLIEKLDSFLGFPKFDPHGDPIPDQHGNFPIQTK